MPAADAAAYMNTWTDNEVVFGVHHSDLGQVRNVRLGLIDQYNSRANISIFVEETFAWGRGVGKMAVQLAAIYLFERQRLNRLGTGSSNLAFLNMTAKLGWQIENVLKQGVKLFDGFRDHTLVAQLRQAFRRCPDLEAVSRRMRRCLMQISHSE